MTLNKSYQRWIQLFALLALLKFSHGVTDEEGTCIWSGNCGRNPQGKCLTCYTEGKPPAKLKNDKARNDLFKACPHFRDEYGNDPKVCCTHQQIEDLIVGFDIARPLLGKCPTCFLNFRKNFCASTCNPRQKQFLNVTKTIRGKKEPCGTGPNSEGSPRNALDEGKYLIKC